MKKLWVIFLIVSLCSFAPPFEKPFLHYPIVEPVVLVRQAVAVPKAYYGMIVMVCDFYDLPQYYFSKMLEVESNFNPRAVSGPNADGSYDYGLAQLNSKYLDEFGWRYKFGTIDPFNPEQAIHVAGKHLSVLYAHTGTWEKAFMAYNIGLSRVLSGKISGAGVEYVNKIFGRSDT